MNCLFSLPIIVVFQNKFGVLLQNKSEVLFQNKSVVIFQNKCTVGGVQTVCLDLLMQGKWDRGPGGGYAPQAFQDQYSGGLSHP